MSKPRNYWFGIVKTMTMRYSKLDCNNLQERAYYNAITAALEYTALMEHAEERRKVIDDILLHNRRTIDGEAIEIYWSKYTIQRWLSQFIYMVGRNVGFADNEKRKGQSYPSQQTKISRTPSDSAECTIGTLKCV